MKLFIQLGFIVCFLFCLQTQAQEEDSTNRQLSINVALVTPIYYSLNVTYQHPYGPLSTSNTTIKPDYKLSYAFGVQYKTKSNLLLELQFQPYTFSYKGPLIVEDYGRNITKSWYETFKYTQNRYSIGIGCKGEKKRSSLNLIIGVSFFAGTASSGDSYFDIKYFDADGKPSSKYNFTSQIETNTLYEVKKFAPYLNIGYGYSIFKNFAISASINYSILFYKGQFGSGDYTYNNVNLLSFNLGAKYNIINKPSKAKQ